MIKFLKKNSPGGGVVSTELIKHDQLDLRSMRPARCPTLFNAVLTMVLGVIFFAPAYILVVELSNDKDLNEQLSIAVSSHETRCSCLEPPEIIPADDGTQLKEEQRLIKSLTDIQTACDYVELPGLPNKTLTNENEDLRSTSYICIGGKLGLRKHDCLVYSFGIKHRWTTFSELVANNLGCRVFVFDPALDQIDHFYTKSIRFFNARLSDFDQAAKYKVPGPNGWKYRKFLTLIKEIHFTEEPIDHLRFDASLDFQRGMSTMLRDGSLQTFVKQLSLEYDIKKKNASQVREMFGITQWLNRQGFLLAHSQATKLSGKSYSVTYVNTKMDVSNK